MMDFFRRYPRVFLVSMTFAIMASFISWSVFETLAGAPKEDRTVAVAVDGSVLKLSEITALSRFLSLDREDAQPNFCNDGVLRYDFLSTGLAELVASFYWDDLREGIHQRWEKAKKYRPYAHPQAPFLGSRSVWERFAPGLVGEMEALQGQSMVSEKTFASFVKLYQMQTVCPPDMVRRVLSYYAQQFPNLPPDPALQYEDFSLFGFRSITDWLGRDFVDLSSEFILNTARLAKEQGLHVSLEEARGDLLHNFNDSMQKWKETTGQTFQGSLAEHLRLLGLDEQTAAECWRSVLLFRRYFEGLSEPAFIDRLAYRDFTSFANETAILQVYELPSALRMKSEQDVLDFQVYTDCVSEEKDRFSLPKKIRSLERIEKNAPELVQSSYRVKIGQSSKEKVGLKASLKEVLQWAVEEEHWTLLKKTFGFSGEASSLEQRYRILENLDPAIRSKVDRFVRLQLVAAHPEWVHEHLNSLPLKEQIVHASKEWISLPSIRNPVFLAALIEEASQGLAEAKESLWGYEDGEGNLYRIEMQEKIEDRHLLTLQEAKRQGILRSLSDRFLEKKYVAFREKDPTRFKTEKGDWKALSAVKEEVVRTLYPEAFDREKPKGFEKWMKEALLALKNNPEDPRWISTNTDPLLDQFRLVKNTRAIQRKEKGEWMTDDAFIMMPRDWSDVHVAPDGNIAFFYFEGKQQDASVGVNHWQIGKTLIVNDAKRYAAEKLLAKVKQKHAMMVPLMNQPTTDEP